jgi:hypothetical protein
MAESHRLQKSQSPFLDRSTVSRLETLSNVLGKKISGMKGTRSPPAPQFHLQAEVAESMLVPSHNFSVGFTPNGVQEEGNFNGNTCLIS